MGRPDKNCANIHRTGGDPKQAFLFFRGLESYRESRLPLLVTAFNAGTSGDRRGRPVWLALKMRAVRYALQLVRSRREAQFTRYHAA